MGISDDRWTCPECDRTFIVEDSYARARGRLAAVRAVHAVEHVDRSPRDDALASHARGGVSTQTGNQMPTM